VSIIQTYSRLASQYESSENLNSLWGKITQQSMSLLRLRGTDRVVVEVGPGPGLELVSLIETNSAAIKFIGVEPAENKFHATLNSFHHFLASWSDEDIAEALNLHFFDLMMGLALKDTSLTMLKSFGD